MQKQFPVIVDSHCHLNRIDLSDFNGDLANVLSTAKSNGVEHFLTVSVEIEDLNELKKNCRKISRGLIFSGLASNECRI
jgi:TatD DNase family protein